MRPVAMRRIGVQTQRDKTQRDKTRRNTMQQQHIATRQNASRCNVTQHTTTWCDKNNIFCRTLSGVTGYIWKYQNTKHIINFLISNCDLVLILFKNFYSTLTYLPNVSNWVHTAAVDFVRSRWEDPLHETSSDGCNAVIVMVPVCTEDKYDYNHGLLGF